MAEDRTPHPDYPKALEEWLSGEKAARKFGMVINWTMDEPCVFCLHPRLMSMGGRGCDNYVEEKQERCGCACQGGKPK